MTTVNLSILQKTRQVLIDGRTQSYYLLGGLQGPQGSPGVGVPSGGNTGQVLAKNSNTNYDTVWITSSGGGGTGNVPAGGTAGQFLSKNSGIDYDSKWQSFIGWVAPGSVTTGIPYCDSTTGAFKIDTTQLAYDESSGGNLLVPNIICPAVGGVTVGDVPVGAPGNAQTDMGNNIFSMTQFHAGTNYQQQMTHDGAGGYLLRLNVGGSPTTFFNITVTGNIVPGNAAVATGATDGFVYLTACAGPPTGVPTSFTGRRPLVIDSTNNKLYFYSGSWLSALTGNQNITLSGDATGSGTTAITLTLANVNANTGTFNTLTVNAKGLVTAASNTAYITGNQTITLSGDASGSGTTAITVTLPSVNANVGTFNNVTVNAKGLVTAAWNVSYLTANQSITLSGDATGSGATAITVTLATVNANTGSFGDASHVGSFTVNGKGLITAASSIAIAISAAAITSGQLALAQGGTHADLSATGGVNQFLKQTGAGSNISVATISAADVSGALTAGYGIAKATATFSKAIWFNAIISAGAVTLDGTQSDKFWTTLSANITSVTISGIPTGQAFSWKVIQDGTGGRTIAWFAGITWYTVDGNAPTINATLNKATWVHFVCTGTNTYDGFLGGTQF